LRAVSAAVADVRYLQVDWKRRTRCKFFSSWRGHVAMSDLKREAKRRVVADRVDDLLENFIAQRLSKNRSVAEISRLLRREVGKHLLRFLAERTQFRWSLSDPH
jgi:hypothetical protein